MDPAAGTLTKNIADSEVLSEVSQSSCGALSERSRVPFSWSLPGAWAMDPAASRSRWGRAAAARVTESNGGQATVRTVEAAAQRRRNGGATAVQRRCNGGVTAGRGRVGGPLQQRGAGGGGLGRRPRLPPGPTEWSNGVVKPRSIDGRTTFWPWSGNVPMVVTNCGATAEHGSRKIKQRLCDEHVMSAKSRGVAGLTTV
jgi:hypothetical protein